VSGSEVNRSGYSAGTCRFITRIMTAAVTRREARGFGPALNLCTDSTRKRILLRTFDSRRRETAMRGRFKVKFYRLVILNAVRRQASFYIDEAHTSDLRHLVSSMKR